MINRLKQWLWPGLELKRWWFLQTLGYVVTIFGLIITLITFINQNANWNMANVIASLIYIFDQETFILLVLGIVSVTIGLLLIFQAQLRITKTFTRLISPETTTGEMREKLYLRRHRERGPKIVVIGGGSGLATLLRGLKAYSTNLTAIVTVADDGGSSGRLREELGIIPPGDIRNCLVAMSETETLLTDLFNYRFTEGNGLSGHNFGNLFLAAMAAVSHGDFCEAINGASKVLAVHGSVIPATLDNVSLVAEFDDGSIIRGESHIGRSSRRISKLSVDPINVQALPEALQAIREADAIIIGPGSLYTSIIPNLRIHGIVEELKRTPALKLYICNVLTQPGETTGLSAADHYEALISHSAPKIIDYMLVNTKEIELPEEYQIEGGRPVVVDFDRLDELPIRIVEGDFIQLGNLIRHDADALANRIVEVITLDKRVLERRRALVEYLEKIE